MKFEGFQVTNYRNIADSNWIDVNQVTAFVGQNESGKSNLFDALYRINPFISGEDYNINEDWPVDNWGEKKNAKGTAVCVADFSLDQDEINYLYEYAAPTKPSVEVKGSETETEITSPPIQPPSSLKIRGSRSYGNLPTWVTIGGKEGEIDPARLQSWVEKNVPKFVYIHDYEMSGSQVELDQLKNRWDKVGRDKPHLLINEDQTILIILDLAEIELDDFIEKGTTQEGRTTRTFDKKSASKYLSNQFNKLWQQKTVAFSIEIDGPTLNILVEDEGMGMPVRLLRRSTGFRWYVSFAWKFTHASRGQYKNCILLLEEPGIHLHYDGQRDLLGVFEKLSEYNAILYTTHLASMVDLANPERVRIVEIQDHHTIVVKGVVSSQRAPMAVIELSLGLTGDMSGLLGNRQSLIVEGGDDALIIQKLSGLLRKSDLNALSDRIYLWPAEGASKTPMFAAFAVGQRWHSGVLLDNDMAGKEAKKKIADIYLHSLAKEQGIPFKVLMLDKAAGIAKTDCAIEDLFPDEFFLECVNAAFGLAIKMEALPVDGSTMITKRVEAYFKENYNWKELDKRRVFGEMLKKFDTWKDVFDLPTGTREKAEKLFETINAAFDQQ